VGKHTIWIPTLEHGNQATFPPDSFGGLDVRPARNAFVQILCNAYNVDVSAAIIILTLNTLHGRRVFDVHFFQSLLGKNNLALMGVDPNAVDLSTLTPPIPPSRGD